MAGKGPLPKNSGRSHKAKSDTAVEIVKRDAAELVVIPAPPVEEILPATVRVWEALFDSPIARVLDLDADMGVLRRWLTTVDQYERATADLRDGGESPITLGSRGQAVISPLVKYIAQLEAQIGRYEKELGLTPMARARLGLKIVEGQLTAAQINAMGQAIPVGIDGDENGWEAWEEPV